MKKHLVSHYKVILILPLVLSLFACNKEQAIGFEKTSRLGNVDEKLAGKWLLVERGYSIGAGYTITQGPTTPEQTLTFTDNNTLSVEGKDLAFYENIKSYQVKTDATGNIQGITVLVDNTKHSSAGSVALQSGDSLRISLQNDTLKIYGPYCIEGCHDGFVRIK